MHPGMLCHHLAVYCGWSCSGRDLRVAETKNLWARRSVMMKMPRCRFRLGKAQCGERMFFVDNLLV